MDKERRKLMTVCRGTRLRHEWSVDYDYLQKLSLKELRFLASFTHLHYLGNPTASKMKLSDKAKKVSYKNDNRARIDILNQGLTVDFLWINSVADYYSEDYVLDLIDACATFKK